VAVSPEWVEYLKAGIVQGDGTGPAELPCPGLGNHSRELSVEGHVFPREAEARTRSSTWSIVRRRAPEIHNAAEITEEGAADYADT
jgi:hypothetical protein